MANGLEEFLDFAIATRDNFIGDPKRLMSQASNYHNTLYGTMLRGLTEKLLLQAGSKIKDVVQLDYTNSFAAYGPNDAFEYTDTNSLTPLEVNWRYTKVSSVVHELVDDLQNGNRAETYARVRDAKESERELSFWEGHEKQLFETPDYHAMENPIPSDDTQLKPYSLRCFVTDDGLFPSTTNGGVVGDVDFTTLMTVPSTKTRWRNQVAVFDNTSDATRRAETNGVITAMDDVWMMTQYKSPTNSQQYVQDTKLSKQKIVANQPSQKLYMSLIRESNEQLVSRNDAGYGTVTHHGIPIEWINALDFIDTDVAVTVGQKAIAQNGDGKLGFRFRFFNFNYIRPIFHTKHHRRLQSMKVGPKQPHAAVLFENTMENLWCSNRRNQGIVRARKSSDPALAA